MYGDHAAMPAAQRLSSVSSLAISALAVELGAGAPTEIRLIPAGRFRAVDGRPGGDLSWNLSAPRAQAIVAAAAARASDLVIDYEHATLSARESGAKAPAAGWFKALAWREGDGLYATDVRWTATAAEMIGAGEKRYLSPVFGWNKQTGEVLSVLMAALVNAPGLDGLTDLSALAALSFAQESDMDDLLQQLCWMLNLPVGTPPADASAHLQKIIDQLKPTAAAGFELGAYLEGLNTQVAALSTMLPDPAKWAPVTAVSALQNDLATAQSALSSLQAERQKEKVDAVVVAALAGGKLTPALDAWARDLGNQNIDSLSAYLAGVTPGVVPGTTQSGGTAPQDATAALGTYTPPAGYSTDPRAMEIHTAALAYQRDHANTPYEAAVAAVSKP